MSTKKIEDEQLTASAVVERMKEALGVVTDTQLAEALRTSKQNISKWKSRQSVPYAEAVFVSLSRGVSLDYLLLGKGGRALSKIRRRSANVDEQIVRAALTNLRASGIFQIPEEIEPLGALATIARGVVSQYARAEEVMRELTKKGLKPEDARKAAVTAMVLLCTDDTASGISRRLGW